MCWRLTLWGTCLDLLGILLGTDIQQEWECGGVLAAHPVGDLLGLLLHLVHLPADEALDRCERVLRVDHALALGDLAHQPVAALGVCHHRRRRARTCQHERGD